MDGIWVAELEEPLYVHPETCPWRQGSIWKKQAQNSPVFIFYIYAGRTGNFLEPMQLWIAKTLFEHIVKKNFEYHLGGWNGCQKTAAGT